ncbi:unnamed protein product [Effrenium voratum]|nr:unnamed protein product [Effrenium voratum]
MMSVVVTSVVCSLLLGRYLNGVRQRVDGLDKVWRVGESQMSLATEKLFAGINAGVTGLRQSFSAVASAFTFYPESETPKQAEKEQTVASSLLEAGDEGLQDLQEDMLRLQGNIFGFAPAPTPSEPEIPIPKRSQKSVVRPRSPQKVPTLNIKLPPVWDLQQGQAVEVRTNDPVENSSQYKWSAWRRAVVEEGFSIASGERGAGRPVRAHAVRRPGGVDFLRVGGDLPRDPEDSSALARPNVDMHSDSKFSTCRCDRQEKAFYEWRNSLPADCRLVLLEVGLESASRDMLQVQRAANEFPHCSLIRLGARRSVSHQWKGRCWHLSGPCEEVLSRLAEALGDAPEEVSAVTSSEGREQVAPLEPTEPTEQAADNPTVERSQSQRGSAASGKASKADVKSEADAADGLVHWDEIPESEVKEEDALNQLSAFAAGVYASTAAALDPESGSEESELKAAGDGADAASDEG